MADWKKIKTEYITTNTSYRKLAQKYGISESTIYARGGKEKWVEQKERYQSKTVAKTINAIGDKQVDRAARLQTVADKLLTKVESLLDEHAELLEDTSRMRDISRVLKDLKDIQMIKSEADIREQEARIEKLRADAVSRRNDDDDDDTGVILMPPVIGADDDG